jgi:acetyl esterase/lipase
VGGHSAGAQLAAILCTDDRYLREAGAAFDTLIGCVPVDGDTYDIPAIIEVAETRNRVHGLPMPKFGHRLKFGNDPALHKDFSAVTHIAKGKSIPPFLTLYVSSHPDTTAQAIRLTEELKAAAVNARAFGAKNTNHSKLNNDLGLDGDPATKELDAFVTLVLNR